MRWKDEQAWIAHADECHQHKVRRMVVGQFAFLLNEFIAITDGSFIAVVAIGDEDRLVVKESFDLTNQCGIVDRPHSADHVQMIPCFNGKHSIDGSIELVLDGTLWIGIKPEDGAEVGVNSLH